MDSFPRRVAENILPLSVAGTLPAAFREWHFTGQTVDHEIPEETCRLCDKERLRYHFEIRNDQTGYRLDVGSECILKFQVAISTGAANSDRTRRVKPLPNGCGRCGSKAAYVRWSGLHRPKRVTFFRMRSPTIGFTSR